MKELFKFLFAVLPAFVFLASCEEEPPYIDFHPPRSTFDTTYIVSPVPSAQPKEVLIEDVSGASCVNCPAAAEIAHSLVVANPGRVNVVTIYPNTASLKLLTDPINKGGVVSNYDFRVEAGTAIVEYVTIPPSLPAGYIDRKKFSGGWYQPKDNWASDVTDELTGTTPVNIDINPSITGTNHLRVDVTITYTQARTDSNFFHLYILQDSIVDAQETRDANNNTIYDPMYVHNHNLMEVLTSNNGDLINNTAAKTLVPGRVIKTRYEINLGARTSSPSSYPQPTWDLKHLKVVGFVTEAVGTKYVLQSKEKEVK